MKKICANSGLHSRRRHQSPSPWWWSHLASLRHPPGYRKEHREYNNSQHQLRKQSGPAPAQYTDAHESRSPTTRSTSTSTARTSSSKHSWPTTVPSSSQTTGDASQRSSVVQVRVPGTRSPTGRGAAVGGEHGKREYFMADVAMALGGSWVLVCFCSGI